MSNNRKVYSFKSVGKLDDEVFEESVNTIVSDPIGIVTPVSFAKSGGTLFSMNFDVATQIRDNLKNLLLTNTGERLMLHDFGANLRPLAFELSNDQVATRAIRQISNSVSKYMPFVVLENFETRVQSSDNGNTVGIVVGVTYSVPTIGATDQAVEVIIYAAG